MSVPPTIGTMEGYVMPTPTGPKETWRDWVPNAPEPDHLFTRDDVIALATREGTEVTVSDLRYWEALGITPRPIRRQHNGAVRALYPIWVVFLLHQVRTLQREGHNLRRIKHEIRAFARTRNAYSQLNPAADDRQARRAAAALSGQPEPPDHAAMIPELVTALERQADRDASITGVPTDRLEVHVFRVDGTATRHRIPIAPGIEPIPAIK